MKAVYQRVSQASVEVDGKPIASIGRGVLLLLGVTDKDTREEAEKLAKKVAELRVFCDDADKMNLSVRDVDGSILVVSNFTLCADTSHGRRPNFIAAARPEQAMPLYEYLVSCLREMGVREVQTGQFGADMKVSVLNDGPVTLVLDTEEWKK